MLTYWIVHWLLYQSNQVKRISIVFLPLSLATILFSVTLLSISQIYLTAVATTTVATIYVYIVFLPMNLIQSIHINRIAYSVWNQSIVVVCIAWTVVVFIYIGIPIAFCVFFFLCKWVLIDYCFVAKHTLSNSLLLSSSIWTITKSYTINDWLHIFARVQPIM